MTTNRRTLILCMTAACALAAVSVRAEELIFTAKLDGASQVPEPVKTRAEGTLQLKVSPDGKRIAYTLSVTNLANATSAELHLGQTNANGPVVARLFPKAGGGPKKGPFSGVLAEGTIDAAELTGPMLGGSMADLIEQFQEGNAYTNVHTSDGVDPPDSGPGDYRLGEIRGQIHK
jgi:hypothetical protein